VIRRLVIPALLLLEGVSTGLWIARLVPMLGAYGTATTLLILVRGVVAATQCMAGWLMFDDRPPATPMAIWSLLASAVLITLELGARLAPSDNDPTFRWYVVGAYWVYALGLVWYLARPLRNGAMGQ
jgi:hypothetical protein